jgi:hypothetical protein
MASEARPPEHGADLLSRLIPSLRGVELKYAERPFRNVALTTDRMRASTSGGYSRKGTALKVENMLQNVTQGLGLLAGFCEHGHKPAG